VLVAGAGLLVSLGLGGVAGASYVPGEPAAVNPGEPVFSGAANPVPPEGVPYDPSKNMMQAIYDNDVANGGTSYWFDGILARPFMNGDSALLTRGRALYMYSHTPGTLGFAGGYAYRERPTGGSQSLYTVAMTGTTLTETTASQLQYPSYFSGTWTGSGVSVDEKKFITYDDVAVTDLKVTNTGTAPITKTITASSPIATTASADGSELTGQLAIRYALTTIYPRFSGDGFSAAGGTLSRTITLDPGASISLKLQLGTIAKEIPDSQSEYDRYRGYDPDTAWKTQMAEYNKFWVDTTPYVDIPNDNVKKISYYRTWDNRFNTFDGDIPGNDYQFPVDLEGALGYNNQISLTVPMRMRDEKWWRTPLYSYGSWLSQGEESGCQAFHDNPGNTANWNNTYEQWTAEEAWNSYLVHGGPKTILNNLAKYSECDVEGTLAKFDTNGNNLIEYSAGTLPGNDADSVAFAQYGTRPQDRTETSFWAMGAKAAASEYTLLGNSAKADQMSGIADSIDSSIMTNLWADGPVTSAQGGQATGPRATGKVGSGALSLSGSGEYVTVPPNVVQGVNGDYSISVWVDPRSNSAWSRILDFGTGTSKYMFLTTNAGSGPRFAITLANGSAGEQQLSASKTLPLNQWSNIIVTLQGTTATMYVNGAVAATNANMTIHPADLAATNQDWIGRSQFGDPLLNGTVDDLNIYSHALSSDEIAAIAGGAAGHGDVLDYAFDEASGATATDSSPNGEDGTVVSPTPISCPGKVFLQRDLSTGNLVCWKDQQNFAPFIDGIVPDTPNYTQALRYYADASEFGIMPVYTADQADKAAATAFGNPGSNNFSNINSTLQACLYSEALRNYPSQYITPDMYRQLIEWLSWNEDINGDNRFPDNNEYYYNWNPTTKTLTRSSIHHDELGSFNWMIYQDVAGLQARLDDTIELWPIDMGYDHFTVNNLSYHGSNVTIVWQKPGGTQYYPLAPMGYSLYVDGQRVLTVDDLAHLTWDSQTGEVKILDGSSTDVQFNQALPSFKAADQVSLSGDARVVDAFQKAGVDLTAQSGSHPDLAQGQTATASFSTTSPNSAATPPANAVDGFTISGAPVTSGAYVGRDPIWSDVGTPNAQDWLAVDLGAPKRFSQVKLYFYSNKAFGTGGSTIAEPSAYSVQYNDGTGWVDVPGQSLTPAAPAPNYNVDDFPPITAQQVRVLVTKQSNRAVGIKEIQVFDATPATTATLTPAPQDGFYGGGGTAPTVTLAASAPAGATVASTEFDLDDAGWRPYLLPFQVTGDGQHTLQYRSTDSQGNVEQAETLSFSVDATAPVTTATTDPTLVGGAADGTATVTLSATDAGSGVAGTQYRIDGGDWQDYGAPFAITAGGVHAVDYRSTDDAGNVETPKTLSVQIDPQAQGGVSGTVPSTLSLALGDQPSFGTFAAGVAQDYDAATTVGVTSSAGDATLSVADPDTSATAGHLVNGLFSLPQALKASASSPAGSGGGALAPVGASPLTLLSWTGPVSNDPVTVHFQQSIGSSDALRTGSYAKTLTFTLATTTP